MPGLYANSYIDQLFATRDLDTLYQVIEATSERQPLPEEFWLFCRLYEWDWARSEVWRYFEVLPKPTFDRMIQAMDQFNLGWIAEQYRLGQRTWNTREKAQSIDTWLERHAPEIHAAIFDLIAKQKDSLKVPTSAKCS
jgi:hypothetical protein